MNRLEKQTEILNHYGWRHQLRKLGEETYELHEALIDYDDEPTEEKRKHVIEEVADCKVLSMQMLIHYNAFKRETFDNVNDITERRKDKVLTFSTFLMFNFIDLSVAMHHNANAEKKDNNWCISQICNYSAVLAAVCEKYGFEEETVSNIMTKKIDRQIERIKYEKLFSSTIAV